MSDLEWFFREEKRILDMPEEPDEDYLARVYGYRPSEDATVAHERGTSEAPIKDADRPRELNVDMSESLNEVQKVTVPPEDLHINQGMTTKRKSSTERTVDPSVRHSKKRRLSPEHKKGSASVTLAHATGSASDNPDSHELHQTSVGPPTDAAGPQSPVARPPIQQPVVKETTITSPAPDKGKAREHEANHVDPPLHPYSKSTGRIIATNNDKQPDVPSPQQASDDATRTTHARYSSHAKRTVKSKVIEVSTANPGPAAAPSSSSVTTPAAPGPSSSKVSGARAKKAEEPKPKTDALKKEKSGKKKRELITPREYAQRLQDNLSEVAATRKSRASPYLRGKRIYYHGGDMQYASEETRKRMDYIIRYGGTVVPTYDPEVITHIVTTEKPSAPAFLRATGLRSLRDIPNHIPTVTWSWVIRAPRRVIPETPVEKGGESTDVADNNKGDKTEQIEDSSSEPTADYHLIVHAAFKDRLDAGMPPPPSNKGRSKPQQSATSAASGPSRPTPQEPKSGRDGSDTSIISEFTVDRVESKQSAILDFDDSSFLGKLAAGPNGAGVPGRATVTDNPKSSLNNKSDSTPEVDSLAPFYNQARAEREAEDLRSGLSSEEESAKEIGNGGKRAATHAVSKKRVRRFVHVFCRAILTLIQGFLCDSKAEEHTACANQDVVNKLQELRELHKAKLSKEDTWKVYTYDKAIRALRSYPTRIRCYEEALAIPGIGDKTAQKITEILQTGDLRRIGYEKTEDIEAINMFQGIYGVGRQTAYKWYANGCRTLDDVRARKGGIKLSTCQEIGLEYYADFLTVPYESRGAALLYYTGDDIFNRSLRLKANKMGYSLNQRGLYQGIVRNPSNKLEKLNEGTIIASETEEEILRILGVPWQEPHERIRG
ncbi:hypothetical protein EVJ58_g880 [Rhodofomes roseus]|uniref:BRCT domain-containing protein n=1 Tax=Rhodofomes roseus TaxID=34475 RepID=A0A4Y9Z200_9APHY|nr:hypothetical protein EVJ58_g880 [Rhodofomes roseus]